MASRVRPDENSKRVIECCFTDRNQKRVIELEGVTSLLGREAALSLYYLNWCARLVIHPLRSVLLKELVVLVEQLSSG